MDLLLKMVVSPFPSFLQVISEYKKTYGDEELPEFLRPHVKENSRRKFLQKTKSQAIFDGKVYRQFLTHFYNFFLLRTLQQPRR